MQNDEQNNVRHDRRKVLGSLGAMGLPGGSFNAAQHPLNGRRLPADLAGFNLCAFGIGAGIFVGAELPPPEPGSVNRAGIFWLIRQWRQGNELKNYPAE